MKPLKTNRGVVKFILLTAITFGIYALFFYSGIGEDTNLICTPYDGKKTMHYVLLTFIISPLTAGIATYVWFHRLSNRIGEQLRARGINYSLSATDYWVFGAIGPSILVAFFFILFVFVRRAFFLFLLAYLVAILGPFYYTHKLCTAMNLLCEQYNIYGR